MPTIFFTFSYIFFKMLARLNEPFREPLRTYEKDTRGIEEQSIWSKRNYSAILATQCSGNCRVVTIHVDTGFVSFSGVPVSYYI
jgi:hypothetical protein